MPLNGALIAARHPFIRHRAYERRVERGRHGFVFFRSSLEEGADRTAGPDAEARVTQLSALLIALERHGYRRTDVGASSSWHPADPPRRPPGTFPCKRLMSSDRARTLAVCRSQPESTFSSSISTSA